MATLTDPARELSDLCRRLPQGGNSPGDAVLAGAFQVELWSADFFEINFFIVDRIRTLQSLVSELSLDEDTKAEAVGNLGIIQNAFSAAGHRNQWTHSVHHYLSATQLGPLALLSGLIRPIRSYPKLDDAEIADLLALTDQLLEWLVAHQLTEQDFVRQCLIAGVNRFRFRLARLGWVGWGYTQESLRDVIGAYFALERGTITDGSNPVGEAMLKRTGDFVRTFYEKVNAAKDVTEAGDFMLRAYGIACAVSHALPHVAGLLTG